MTDVTEEDFRERFEIDAEGVIRWRKVVPVGGERFAVRAAQRLNLKAGEPVQTWDMRGCPHTSLYGRPISQTRLRMILQGMSDAEAAKACAEISASANDPKGRTLPRGVTELHGYYVARIKVNGKHMHLGHFKTIEEAASARRQAEIEKGAR